MLFAHNKTTHNKYFATSIYHDHLFDVDGNIMLAIDIFVFNLTPVFLCITTCDLLDIDQNLLVILCATPHHHYARLKKPNNHVFQLYIYEELTFNRFCFVFFLSCFCLCYCIVYHF